jgi:hypothetical protein
MKGLCRESFLLFLFSESLGFWTFFIVSSIYKTQCFGNWKTGLDI